MNPPKVSIIIPVYNTPEAYLRQCLDSVLSQTLKELEIICVDDCSTDGSLAILEEYKTKNPNIKLIKHVTNQGISVARNTGASHVAGEYLYFIDCDDWIESKALQSLYVKASSQNVDLLLFAGTMDYEEEHLKQSHKQRKNYLQYENIPEKVMKGYELFQLLQDSSQYHAMIWLQLTKTSYFQENQLAFHPLTSCAGEDLVYSFQNYLTAERALCVPDIYYHYRLRTGSGSTKKRDYSFIKGYSSGILLSFLQAESLHLPEDVYSSVQKNLESRCLSLSRCYREITGEESTKVLETLENMKHLLSGQALTQKDTWGDFLEQQLQYPHFCFFGAGIEGQETLDFLKAQGWGLPVAICDNGVDIQGKNLDGIPVISFEEALLRYPNLCILITNRRFYQEIFTQVRARLEEHRILKLHF